MPGDKDSKIPRIPWRGGSRSTESVDLSNQRVSPELIRQEREQAERMVASVDYIEHLSALAQANEYLATERPHMIQAYFRSLPKPDEGVKYTEQQLAYVLAFLMLTDEDTK